MPTAVAMRDDRKNIFIIGPMAASGTPLGNIFELKKASEQALANLATSLIAASISRRSNTATTFRPMSSTPSISAN